MQFAANPLPIQGLVQAYDSVAERRPLPRVLVRELVEAADQPFPRADRLVLQSVTSERRIRRSEDGTHILQPPAEMRKTATQLGFDYPTLEAQGFDAIETRVARTTNSSLRSRGSRSGRAPGQCVSMAWSGSAG